MHAVLSTTTAVTMAVTQILQLTVAVTIILLPAVFSLPLPAVDSPFLAIKINREQGGIKYGYDSAVSKQAQNLVVSGKENHTKSIYTYLFGIFTFCYGYVSGSDM